MFGLLWQCTGGPQTHRGSACFHRHRYRFYLFIDNNHCRRELSIRTFVSALFFALKTTINWTHISFRWVNRFACQLSIRRLLNVENSFWMFQWAVNVAYFDHCPCVYRLASDFVGVFYLFFSFRATVIARPNSRFDMACLIHNWIPRMILFFRLFCTSFIHSDAQHRQSVMVSGARFTWVLHIQGMCGVYTYYLCIHFFTLAFSMW